MSFSMCIVRGAVISILAGESFTIPTDGAKKYLEITQAVMKQFAAQTSADDVPVIFSFWLVNILEELVKRLMKRSGVINREQLWSRYHEFTISEVFKKGWEEFWEYSKIDKEPMFYQHITDEVFEKLIQHSVSLESTDTQQCEENDILLTYEKENAVTYVAGYVIYSLLQ